MLVEGQTGNGMHDATGFENGELPLDFSEFALLMEGPQTLAASASERALANATIAGLQGMLARLRPLGARLAEVDAARLAAETALHEMRAELAACQLELAEQARLVTSLRRRLREKKLVIERERRRHKKTRARVGERQRLATQRWLELRRERARAGRLERELAKERTRWEAVRAPLCDLALEADARGTLERMPLARLMRLVVEERPPRRSSSCPA